MPSKAFKEKIGRLPIVGPTAKTIWNITRPIRFHLTDFHSAEYWDSRYAAGGNSGAGSSGELAEFKAAILNSFVVEHNVRSVIEFGCGDGHQLSLANYPRYLGLDISPTAVLRCQTLFGADPTKRFTVYDNSFTNLEQADVALSLDVIFHLVEDDVYKAYMRDLFAAARRFVIIYSDNEEFRGNALHVRHRRFSNWIQRNRPDWQLVRHIPNKFGAVSETEIGSWSDFWIYARTEFQSHQ